VSYDVAHLSVESIAVADNGAGTPIDQFILLPPSTTSDYIEATGKMGALGVLAC
jgi:hypothetical protein